MDGYTFELLARVEAKLDYLINKLKEAEDVAGQPDIKNESSKV